MAESPEGQELNSDTSTKLARELGLGAAMSTGIGTMICAGIFVLPGIAAAKAGPVVVLAGASNEWRLRQWLFGSLPDKVTNNSSASVLMVRSGA